MNATIIKQIKKGEFFRLSSSDNAPVWVKGYYVPSERKFEAYKFEDTNREIFLRGDKKVYVDFEF